MDDSAIPQPPAERPEPVARAEPVPQAEAVRQAESLDATEPPQESITQPAKLLRIASMVRELLEETRQASLDEPGRVRLREIYDRSVKELAEVLSPDLRDELTSLMPPIDGVPSDAEIRVAQAQLVGWLEGLFHGIQAALFAQQTAARAQFEELRRRGLPSGTDPHGQPDTRGQYL
jgi:proteasome activator-like protein